MAGTYQHVLLSDLQSQLAQDLGDSNSVHFLADETQRALQETFRLWNLLTAYHRTSFSFSTTPGVAWYDLSSLGSSYFSNTVRDVESITALQYRLYEPISPNTGAGISDQFIFTEFIRSLQQVRDQFIADTECQITKNAEVLITVADDGLYELDDDVIRVIRASWRTPSGTRHPLRSPTDTAVLTSAVPNWRTSPRHGIPKKWEIISTPNLTLRLDPKPLADGYLEIWTINTGPTLVPTANSNAGTILDIHDDLSPAVAWGALEHILSKHGIGRDSTRVQFCAQMYGIYREIAKSLPLVLDVQVNGNSIRTSTIRQLDSNRYGWEGSTLNRPKVAALIGDWIALSPVPDSTYSIGVDIVRKTPVTLTSEYVPIGREYLSALLAWAKQLALFKVGGVPLSVAQRSSGLFIEAARRYNESRIADSQFLIEILSQSYDDIRATVPRQPNEPVDTEDPQDSSSSRNARSRNPAYQPYFHPLGR